MKNSMYVAVIALFVLAFSSCSKDLDNVLVGSWSVSEIKAEYNSGTTTTVQDAGTITFAAGGTGSYNITYPVIGNSSGSLTWSADDDNKIVAINAGFSVVTGQYTVVTNKKREQVWRQINANGDKYTYTLKK